MSDQNHKVCSHPKHSEYDVLCLRSFPFRSNYPKFLLIQELQYKSEHWPRFFIGIWFIEIYPFTDKGFLLGNFSNLKKSNNNWKGILQVPTSKIVWN